MTSEHARRTAGRMIATLYGLVAACVAQQGQPPAVTAEDGPETVAEAPAGPLDPRVDAILTRLEQRQINDLIANLKHTTVHVTQIEEPVDKLGTIHYKALKPVSKFAIRFSQKVDSEKRNIDELHIFDGCWYIEVQPRTKTVNRYEVRKPDDPVDPFKVNEGIFPLPFGQQKQDMLQEFVIERRDPARGDPAATDHLVLTPRPGTRLEPRYQTLDIWVAQTGPLAGLPVKVKAAKKKGDGKLGQYITIEFSDVKLNTGFANSVFDFVTPSNYTEEKHPLNAPLPAIEDQP